MSEGEHIVLMNMCMIYDNKGNVLVEDRKKKSWAGIAFPGGHVEAGEAMSRSVIREVWEETGLTIRNPRLCGVKNWIENGTRYMVFFYKTNQFEGMLQSSEEGEVFWIPLDKITEYPLASGFEKNLRMFLQEEISELFYLPDGDELIEY